MLNQKFVFLYPITRDYGFAPNPFHGVCTLATCKPGIRNSADIGDWVVGFTGKNFCTDTRVIYCMEVSEKMTFQQYWENPRFRCKRPVRNGSKASLVGDNIYHLNDERWVQEDSHHSNSDGSVNFHNLRTDTQSDSVLASTRYIYFGRSAIALPNEIIDETGFRRTRNYHKWEFTRAKSIVKFAMQHENQYLMKDLPFNFERASARYTGVGQRVVDD